MSLRGEHVLLRVYLRSGDRTPRTGTSELLVKAARKRKLAGATVLRGILGFGSHGVTRPSAWSLVEHAPEIIEIVDRSENIKAFVEDELPTLLSHGFATLEPANVMLYRQRGQDGPETLSLGLLQRPLAMLPKLQPRGDMKINEDGVLLRVFIGDSDRDDGKPLHEAIIQKARELGLAGATVLRGVEGFGANSVVHRASLLEMSADLPIVIEIVDIQPKIQLLLPHLEKMVIEGMITTEQVMIVMYRHDPAGAV